MLAGAVMVCLTFWVVGHQRMINVHSPYHHHRLEYQLSSLEKEVEIKQQTAVKFETQLAEVQTKYEATPKQEMIDR